MRILKSFFNKDDYYNKKSVSSINKNEKFIQVLKIKILKNKIIILSDQLRI